MKTKHIKSLSAKSFILLLFLFSFLISGCDRCGVGRYEIVSVFGLNQRAEPVIIDPNVHVRENSIKTKHSGLELKQKIVIDGPFKIVPVDPYERVLKDK